MMGRKNSVFSRHVKDVSQPRPQGFYSLFDIWTARERNVKLEFTIHSIPFYLVDLTWIISTYFIRFLLMKFG